MILCSCRVISNSDVQEAINVMQKKQGLKITVESVSQILEKPYIEGNHCLSCIPTIKEEIRKILSQSPSIEKIPHIV